MPILQMIIRIPAYVKKTNWLDRGLFFAWCYTERGEFLETVDLVIQAALDFYADVLSG